MTMINELLRQQDQLRAEVSVLSGDLKLEKLLISAGEPVRGQRGPGLDGPS